MYNDVVWDQFIFTPEAKTKQKKKQTQKKNRLAVLVKCQYRLKYRHTLLKAYIVAWLQSRSLWNLRTNGWITEGRKTILVVEHSAALKE